MPDLAGILGDGAVAGEFPHAGRVEDRHLGPPGLVTEGRVDTLLGIAVGTEIRQAEEGIMVDEIVAEHVEDPGGLVGGEVVRSDPVDHGAEFVVGREEFLGIVTLRPEGLHLLDGHAEDEDVLLADLLADLDVGPVERADRQGPVERELHVTGSGGLLAGGRDLLGEIGGGHDLLGE